MFCNHPTQVVGVAEQAPRKRRDACEALRRMEVAHLLCPPSSEANRGVYLPLRTCALELSSLLDSHEQT